MLSGALMFIATLMFVMVVVTLVVMWAQTRLEPIYGLLFGGPLTVMLVAKLLGTGPTESGPHEGATPGE